VIDWRNDTEKMLIDREKMLVLPFRKTHCVSGFEAASQTKITGAATLASD